MRYTIIIASLLLSSGCAHEDPWTRRDTVMFIVSSTVIAADAVATNRLQDCYGCYEKGPVAKHFLGRTPSTSGTVQYFGTIIVSNFFIGRALPAKWRPYWYSWEIVTHGYALEQTCNLGIC
jgi:hypothetical protein